LEIFVFGTPDRLGKFPHPTFLNFFCNNLLRATPLFPPKGFSIFTKHILQSCHQPLFWNFKWGVIAAGEGDFQPLLILLHLFPFAEKRDFSPSWEAPLSL